MLYSPAAKLAFAHYPKTAGHSLVSWFRESFSDATFVEPPAVFTISHLPVRESLERLGLVHRGDPPPPPRGWQRWLSWAFSQPSDDAGGLRIIGVVREPFEMLVSLYEYWRAYDFPEPPQPLLIRTAREASFREFLALAVGAEPLPTYRDFFDVGGPAWPQTRLLAFESLDAALAACCREFRLPPPRGPLDRRNSGPRPGRDLAPYREQAGSLSEAVADRFRWYATTGRQLMLRG